MSGKDDIIPSDTPKGRNRRRVKNLATRVRLSEPSTMADIQGPVDPAALADCLVFTLVRPPPWVQAPSDHSWLGGRGFAPLSVRPAEAAGFADFLRDPMTQARLSIPTRPYLTGPQGESPAPCPKLEHLSADLPRLEARLGFSPHRLPHENRPDHGDWRAAKDAETAGIVACAAAEGIARFSHRFDPD